jgi:hypothetical protein
MDPVLPFPKKTLTVGQTVAEEYVIPSAKKAEVLAELLPFSGIPGLDEVWLDLHEGRTFRIGDFKVVREHGCNLLVSPYFWRSGGTVIDWIPADHGRHSSG